MGCGCGGSSASRQEAIARLNERRQAVRDARPSNDKTYWTGEKKASKPARRAKTSKSKSA